MRHLALALILALPAYAAPPVPGSDDALAMQGHEAWITRQYSKSGQFCCNLSDGRPAEVRHRDGKLEVFYSREHWGDGTDSWIAVPDSAVLAQASPLLVPIAWILGGRVFCVALPGAA